MITRAVALTRTIAVASITLSVVLLLLLVVMLSGRHCRLGRRHRREELRDVRRRRWRHHADKEWRQCAVEHVCGAVSSPVHGMDGRLQGSGVTSEADGDCQQDHARGETKTQGMTN